MIQNKTLKTSRTLFLLASILILSATSLPAQKIKKLNNKDFSIEYPSNYSFKKGRKNWHGKFHFTFQVRKERCKKCEISIKDLFYPDSLNQTTPIQFREGGYNKKVTPQPIDTSFNYLRRSKNSSTEYLIETAILEDTIVVFEQDSLIQNKIEGSDVNGEYTQVEFHQTENGKGLIKLVRIYRIEKIRYRLVFAAPPKEFEERKETVKQMFNSFVIKN